MLNDTGENDIIATLQERLEKEDHIMIHFPDELIPENKAVIERSPDEGHF